MKSNDLMKRLGQAHGELDTDGFTFEVVILDVREVFGRVEYYVRPVAGRGERWVQAQRVAVSALA